MFLNGLIKMVDEENQFCYVSRQYACLFLGLSAGHFDRLMRDTTNIAYKFTIGGRRRFSFDDLARLVVPDATRQELIMMRVQANILIGGLKNGILGKKEKKSDRSTAG
jgi:hypothetical protein